MGHWVYNDQGQKVAYEFDDSKVDKVNYSKRSRLAGERKQYKNDILQPFDTQGKPNREFEKVYSIDARKRAIKEAKYNFKKRIN